MSAIPAAVNYLRDHGLAVVTGGSSGIGKTFIATVREANPDMRICNLSRTDPQCDGVEHVSCDLADPGARANAFARVTAWAADRASAKAGRLLLINNSGFGICAAFPEPKVSAHVEMVSVNIAAMVELTGALLPELRRRGGAIVNVASTAAFQPMPLFQTYAATKTFVVSWTVALARELRGTGVSALALCPGPTQSAFGARAGARKRRVPKSISQTPDEVVATAFRALRRGRTIAVSGRLNRVVAFAARCMPTAITCALAERAMKRQVAPDGA
jgi:hypothetical protein